ncbi:MAG: HDOD domain-containing protein [Phycisphaeraceae bacterium]|jgi:HD-like signal output (HDOD) protein|nr:HDOD domain-containing protein [Phycisphaeraceae bacterium]
MIQTAPTGVEPTCTQEQAQIVQSAIGEISHIATLPQITMKIIHLVEDPDSTAHDLNNVISNDAALGARILKVVNSTFYGLPGQIGSIDRAIVLLGLNAVKNIAIAVSLAKLFRGGQIAPTFNVSDLWTHSVAVAAGTRLLAKKVGLGMPDEAFLAGLIHDLGIIAEIQARRSKFVEVIEILEADPALLFREAENQVLGACHEQFGAGLCKSWKFPMGLTFVTGFHHRPLDLAPANRGLTCLVHVADVLAAQCEQGYTDTVECLAPASEVLSELNLTQQQLDEVTKQLPEALDEATTLLGS